MGEINQILESAFKGFEATLVNQGTIEGVGKFLDLSVQVVLWHVTVADLKKILVVHCLNF